LQILVAIAHDLDHQALLRLARDDRRMLGLAALDHRREGIEAQAALELLGLVAVALVALLGEQRADAALEELGRGGSRRGLGRGRRRAVRRTEGCEREQGRGDDADRPAQQLGGQRGSSHGVGP